MKIHKNQYTPRQSHHSNNQIPRNLYLPLTDGLKLIRLIDDLYTIFLTRQLKLHKKKL